jgi:hypothetical protein
MSDKYNTLASLLVSVLLNNGLIKLYQSFRGVCLPCGRCKLWAASSRVVDGEAWGQVDQTVEQRLELGDGAAEAGDAYKQWKRRRDARELIGLGVLAKEDADFRILEATGFKGLELRVVSEQGRVRLMGVSGYGWAAE